MKQKLKEDELLFIDQNMSKNTLENQEVTNRQKSKLVKTYKKIYKLFAKINALTEDEKQALNYISIYEKVKKLEFKLQKNWNLPVSHSMHRFTFDIPGCTCMQKSFVNNTNISPHCKVHSHMLSQGN